MDLMKSCKKCIESLMEEGFNQYDATIIVNGMTNAQVFDMVENGHEGDNDEN